MPKKLVISNWKEYVQSPAQAQEILESVNNYLETKGENRESSLIFCPSLELISSVSKLLKESHLEHEAFLGAQDLRLENDRFNAEELKKLGVEYVIIGHSDRRWKEGEPAQTTNKKLVEALKNELIPIVCIGERMRDDNYKEFIEQQIENTFAGIDADGINKCIIAYEPVWAITGNLGMTADSPDNAVESINIIKDVLARNWKLETENLFLYGGSINSENAKDFLSRKEINGVLIGKASTQKEEFLNILAQI